MKKTGRPKIVLIIWICVTLISILLIPFSLMEFISFDDGGGALFFFGIVMGITGLIVTPFFFSRYKTYKKLINEENILAHWKYDKEYWLEFVEKDHQINKKEKFKLFYIVAIICVVIGIFLSIIEPDGAELFIIIFLSIIAFVFIVMLLSVYLPYNSKKKNEGEVYISTDGVLLAGSLHTWKGLSSRFERFEYIADYPQYLEFTYSAATRNGRQEYTVRVPMPQQSDVNVQKVIDYYSKL